MDEALPRLRLFGHPAPDIGIEVAFRPDFKDDALSETELEVLGPVLPELIGELLQMSQDEESE